MILNMPFNTLIFDLDNTLIDRNRALRLAMEEWLDTQGYAGHRRRSALDDIMRQDQWGYTDRTAFGDWLLHTYGAPDTIFKNIISHIRPDPSILSLLGTAKASFRLVLATNGGSIHQRAKLRQAQLESFFHPEAVFISAEMDLEKPDRRFFEKIINDLRLDPEKTMVIGDHLINDIVPALTCGLSTCWVSYGREGIAGIRPHRVIMTTTELSQWLLQ